MINMQCVKPRLISREKRADTIKAESIEWEIGMEGKGRERELYSRTSQFTVDLRDSSIDIQYIYIYIYGAELL